MRESSPHRQTILIIASLSMVSFGIVLTLLGASLPSVILRFGIDKRQAGALLSLLSFSVLVGSVVFGPIVDRRGYKGMLLLAYATIGVGVEVIAFAPTLAWLRIGVILTGFTGGLVNGAANALVADVSGAARGPALNVVGAFFGIGAAGVPFVLAMLAGRVSQSLVLAIVGATVVLPLALSAVSTFPLPKQPRGLPIAQAIGLLRDRLLLLMGIMLFLESGMESTVGGWISTFFAEELSVSPERAPMYLALFWLGLMLTRLFVGLVLHAASSVRVLFVSVALGFASALWLVSTRSLGAAATGVFLLGCGFAPMFPFMFAFVGDRYAHISGTALSVVITMALAGGMLMPYVTGVLGNTYGLRNSFFLVPAALVCLAMLLGVLSPRLAPAPKTAQAS